MGIIIAYPFICIGGVLVAGAILLTIHALIQLSINLCCDAAGLAFDSIGQLCMRGNDTPKRSDQKR